MVKGLRRFNLFRALSLTWIFVPFQWDYLVGHSYSAKSIFLLNSIYTLTAVLFEIPTGVLGDRIGRKRALILGGVAMSLGCGFFLLGGVMGSFVYFAAANIFAALSMTLISGCDSAYLYDLMAAQNALSHYPKVEGRSTGYKLVGNVLGGVVGFAVARVSIEWTFTLTAAVTLVASIVAAFLPEPPPPPGGDLRVHVAESFKIVRRSKVIVSVLFYSLFLFPLLRVGIFLDPPHAKLHGIRAEYLGLAFALKDLVSALGSFNAGRVIEKMGSGKVLIALPLVASMAFLIQGVLHGPWCYLLYLAPALALGFFSPIIRIFINQAITDSSRRATVLSVEGMFRRTGYAFFSPFLGWMLEMYTLNAVFVSMAFLGFAAAGISATIQMLGNGMAKEVKEDAAATSASYAVTAFEGVEKGAAYLTTSATYVRSPRENRKEDGRFAS